ncbi:MAG: hypothetical protein WKG07_06445 [Hymenobacter sp.]
MTHELSVGDTHFPERLLRRVPRHRAGNRGDRGVELQRGDLALQADMISHLGENRRQYHAHPVFLLRNRLVGRVPETGGRPGPAHYPEPD